MLKKHMAACLVVTAFAAAPAFAQTSPSAPTDRPTASGSGSTTSGSPAMQPGATGSSSGSSSMTAPSAASSTMNQGSGSHGQFMTQMQTDQMMASDLIGTRVVSTNNESIGDINDVIVDRNGQVRAVVVGVGGFLGIGEKDVAVPFNSLEFAHDQQASAMNKNGNVATTGSTAAGNTAGQNTAATSNSNMATNNATAGNGNAASNDPDRVILRMTKAELQAAPAFKADSDANANRATTGTTGAGGKANQP